MSTVRRPAPVPGTEPFRYQGFALDPARGLLTCRYAVGDREFAERVSFAAGGNSGSPAAWQAARLIFLLAGVSYYKTAAPPVIDLGQTPVSDAERDFLREFYTEGLGEFGYRNGLDLSGLRITGGSGARPPAPPAPADGPRGVLIPFGGGIDSIVTVEMLRPHADAALFVLSRPGDRFAAIERPAAVTGLPVVRAGREIDPQLLRSAELGFLNGHVPVTGILSAIAVMAAVLDGRDTVVMSNEWSASIPTLEAGGRSINHQYSKSAAFEAGFRRVLDGALGRGMTYFSALRPFSELWVAQRFAALTRYHDAFRSCNRAFHIDPARRLDHWCGQCDKCCFIDLILAPFLPAAELAKIFGGAEPLADPSLAGRFRSLLGTSAEAKPFECVGDVGECRAAAVLAAQRPDRAGTPLLRTLTAEFPPLAPDAVASLLRPAGEHAIPGAYAAGGLLG
ncbi:MAG: endonuclease domain-containing protein [Actinobacteria bacterium]|nr:endonuclease domain-containing protein [Actinomycetota bacterium]